MSLLGDVIAGCSPGQPDCGAGTLPGLDAWFVVLVLVLAALLLLAVVAGAVRLPRRRSGRRADVGSTTEEPSNTA
jgi:hypothetical protein